MHRQQTRCECHILCAHRDSQPAQPSPLAAVLRRAPCLVSPPARAVAVQGRVGSRGGHSEAMPCCEAGPVVRSKSGGGRPAGLHREGGTQSWHVVRLSKLNSMACHGLCWSWKCQHDHIRGSLQAKPPRRRQRRAAPPLQQLGAWRPPPSTSAFGVRTVCMPAPPASRRFGGFGVLGTLRVRLRACAAASAFVPTLNRH